MALGVPGLSALGVPLRSALGARDKGVIVAPVCNYDFVDVLSKDDGVNWIMDIVWQGRNNAYPTGITFEAYVQRDNSPSVGTGFYNADSAALTYAGSCGVVATPGGWRRHVAQLIPVENDDGAALRIDIEGTSSQCYWRVLLDAACGSGTDETYYAPSGMRTVINGATTALDAGVWNADLTLCGGGTATKPFRNTIFRYIEPPGSFFADRSTITEAAGQASIESWANGPLVQSFAGVPQTLPNVRAGCWTAVGGVYMRHGPWTGFAGAYEWDLMVPGTAATPWTNGEEVIAVPGGLWPCTVPL